MKMFLKYNYIIIILYYNYVYNNYTHFDQRLIINFFFCPTQSGANHYDN